MLERIFYHLYFRHSRWSDVKKKLHSDPRYKNVDSSGLREDYFLEFIHDLKDEHKKKKKDKKYFFAMVKEFAEDPENELDRYNV